jgi:hypothetical protein
MHDIEYPLESHTKVRRDTSLCLSFRMHFPYLSNIVFCQFCLPLSLSLRASMALFLHLVIHVRLWATQKYVERVATQGRIAAMTDIRTFWNRSLEKSPRGSMASVIILWAHVKFSVSSIWICGSHPYPASRLRDHFYIVHETLKCIHNFLLVSESHYITDTECL